MKIHHELLSPAGSCEIAKAVIDAGADAVYLAGELFGARAYAGNLTQEELFFILDYAHVRGASIHLTVNTLLKNKEITERLYDYMLPLYERGLDAVIVQDFGVLDFLHRNFPLLSLHASTQMSVADVSGAQFLKECGVSRVVTARELSLEEVSQITAIPDLEVETFIHGALCVCYSGQCLMSSFIGGRSGNRGRCAQPCRLEHRVISVENPPRRGKNPVGVKNRAGRKNPPGLKEAVGVKNPAGVADLTRQARYPLSPKDLCAIRLLPDLCRAGITSFKIEGRMKQKEYAAGVTAIYRKYLDRYAADPDHYRVDPEDYETLMKLGNRSGFTDGYYARKNGPEMMSSRDSSHSSDKTVRVEIPERKKTPVDLYFYAACGEPVRLTAVSGGCAADRTGAVVLAATGKPLSQESVQKQLSKTGSTPFVPHEFQILLGDNVFLPVSELNALRRDVLSELEAAIAESFRRIAGGLQEANDGVCAEEFVRQEPVLSVQNDRNRDTQKPVLSVQISDPAMLDPVLESKRTGRILLDYPKDTSLSIWKRDVQRIHMAGKEAVFCFPYVLRDRWHRMFDQKKDAFADCGFDRVLVRSYDSLGYCLDELAIPAEQIMTDHSLYVFSTEARKAFSAAVSKDMLHTASVELNKNELMHQENANGELILYGRLPLMITAQCLYRNYDGCIRETPGKRPPQIAGSEALRLVDRAGNPMPVFRDCAVCYNVIRQQKPLYLLDEAAAIRQMGFTGWRLIFTDESIAEMKNILTVAEAAVRGEQVENPYDGHTFSDFYTHGHFKRGVQ